MRRLTALCLAAVALGCPPAAPPPFPPDFVFGASVAGFQVDPGCPTMPAAQCEDRSSDWYQFVTSPNELMDLKASVTFEPLANGPGHWELYAQDFERASGDLGLSGLRLSLEWSRIFPTATDGLDGAALRAVADETAIAHYHAMFAALKARALRPLVTLNHYTLPLWLHDGVACHQNLSTCTNKGWLDRPRMLAEIARYARFVAEEFGGEVDTWATLNEPFAVVLPGYLLPSVDRVNPPGVSLRFAEAKQVMETMVLAHARMYDAVKAGDVKDADGDGVASEVGLVYPLTPAKGKTDSRLDVRGAENVFYLYNTAFLDGVIKGLVDADLDGKPDTAEPRADLVGRMDYLGVNYYTRITVEGTGAASFPSLSTISTFNPLTLVLWEDYPKGLYEMLLFAKQRYGLKMIITETGTSDPMDDGTGASWLVRHLTWTRRAIRDGADVKGFYFWSLIDNYEWNHGMSMRFGLYAVGADQAKTRTARQSVAAYRDIVKLRDVPEALLQRFPAPE